MSCNTLQTCRIKCKLMFAKETMTRANLAKDWREKGARERQTETYRRLLARLSLISDCRLELSGRVAAADNRRQATGV